jgi:hypothetical protein
MPKVRIILEDDNGTVTEQTYALSGDLDTLDGIDESVEQFRLEALPQLEKALLEQSQQRAVEQEKKTRNIS